MAKQERSGQGEGDGTMNRFYLILGVLAVVGVAALWLARGGGGPEPLGPLSQADMNVDPDPDAYAAARGPEDAPVTVVEFADYQCSHCARFAALPAPAILRDYVRQGQVRMLLYDFPLSQQTNAIPAALAARCAGAQDRYWEMHDLLFQKQREWAADETPEDKFADYAKQVGLDAKEFGECYSERRFLPEIMASRRYGETLGVSGTPAIFVNGTQTRDYSYGTVSDVIEAKLDSARTASEASASRTGGGAAPSGVGAAADPGSTGAGG